MLTYGVLALVGSLGHFTRPANLLLADARMAVGSLGKVSSPYGVLLKTNRKGIYRLNLKGGLSAVRVEKALQKRGVDHVFPSSAEFVNRDSAKSVSQHIAFLKAAYSVSKGSRREKNEGTEEESGVDFYEALERYLNNRVSSDGVLSREMYVDGVAHRDAMPPAIWGDGGGSTHAPSALFSFVGPKNVSTPYNQYMSAGPVSGRKNGIAFNPTNPNIIYTATGGGGLWRSTDAGVNWSGLSDKWPFLNTSCVALNPTNANVIMVGTGDYYGFFTKSGYGIMRSTNGGASWTNVGDAYMRNSVVNRIVFDPTNSNIVLASAGKDGARRDAPSDATSVLHRSVNGGATWTALTALPGADWDDLDVATDGTFYAAATYPDTTGALYKSTDHGATWVAITNPCANPQPALDLACSKVTAGTLYLLATADEKVFKSTNGGTSWADITGSSFPHGTGGTDRYNWSQRDYDYHISTAKDGSTDLVFVGLITVAMSRGTASWVDVGRSFAATTPNNIHSDQHCMAMNPAQPNQVILGCDGGLWRFTVTPGTYSGTWQSLNANFASDMQFEEMAISPTSDSYLQGGCQDNFSPSARGTYSSWKGLPAGDGCWAGYSPDASGQNFVSNQNGGIYLFTSLADTTGDSIRPTSQAFQTGFFAPYVYAGSPPRIYGGADTLWRYNNNNTWTNFGVDITPFTPGQGEPANVVNELETAKNNPAVVYSGSSNGEVFMILNTTTYKQIDNASIDRPVGAIDTAWTNPYDVLVGLMGGPNGNGRLWRCTDTRATTPSWVSCSGSGIWALPDVPINSIERDPFTSTRWYVATDIGCFMTVNSGVTWAPLNSLNLPNVHTNALYVNPAKTYLYAATFGRGIWRIPLLATANNFSIAGTVKTSVGANVAGATMTLRKLRTHTQVASGSPNTSIPDGNSNGVYIPVSIPVSATLSNVSLQVGITHLAPNDLEIWLVHPNGTFTQLFSSLLPLLPNLNKTFNTTYFNGLPSGGVWQIFIRDITPALAGVLNSYSLTVQYNTFSVLNTATTSAAGTFTFSGLDAGSYMVTPTQAGKTFSPTAKSAVIGPSKTGFNFTRTN